MEHELLIAAHGEASLLVSKQLPAPCGDDIDGAVNHCDGRLVVDLLPLLYETVYAG